MPTTPSRTEAASCPSRPALKAHFETVWLPQGKFQGL